MRVHHSILSWRKMKRVTGPGWTQSQPPTSRSRRARFKTPMQLLTLLDSVTTRSRRSTLPTATWIWSSRRGRDAARCQCHSLAQFDTVIPPARGPPTALHVLRFLPSTGARHRRLFFKISRPLRSEAFFGCRHEYQRPHLCRSTRTHAASSEVQYCTTTWNSCQILRETPARSAPCVQTLPRHKCLFDIVGLCPQIICLHYCLWH